MLTLGLTTAWFTVVMIGCMAVAEYRTR